MRLMRFLEVSLLVILFLALGFFVYVGYEMVP